MRPSISLALLIILSALPTTSRAEIIDLTKATQADADFGPWRGFAPLPNANTLPNDAGTDGVQDWPYLDNWQVAGPIAATARDDKPLDWQPMAPEAATGMLYVAGGYHEEPDRKLRPATVPANSSFLAKTSITAPRDLELFWALGVDGRATLAINDQQAVAGPERQNPQSAEDILIFKATLKKGVNTIQIRLEPNAERAKFSLRVCTRGQPKPNQPGTTPTPLPAPVPMSYRNDGTGRYPSTNPVTAWDVERNINVAWRTPLLWSKAQPVIADNRIFLTEEPQTLTCIDKTTGQVLWRRQVDVLALANPDAVKEAQKLEQTAIDAHKNLLKLGRTPWERLAKFRQQGLSPAEALDKLHQVRQESLAPHDKWVDFVRTAGDCIMPLAYRKPGVTLSTDGSPWTGFSFATPITDGRHVWVHFFTGVFACFDLDGKQEWIVRHKPEQSSGSECSSPVLVDGLLIQQHLHKQPHRLWMRMDKAWLLALDARTGKEAWRADVLDFRANSTPAVMRLKRGDIDMTLLITGSGTVVRVRDGKVLIPRLLGNDGYTSPIVSRDIVYRFGEGPSTAHRLFIIDKDTIGAQRLWGTHTPEEHAGGMAFAGMHFFGIEGGERAKGLHVFEAATGRRLDPCAYRETEGVGPLRWQTVWIPPATAGGLVYLADRGTCSGRLVNEWAHISVMQGHPQGQFLAHNRIDYRLDAPLVIDEDRVLARTDEALTCLARIGKEGEKYELTENARCLLDAIPAAPPPRRDAIAVAPAKSATTRPANFTLGSQRYVNPGQPADAARLFLCDQRRTVRILLADPQAKATLNGTPLAHNDRVALDRGLYTLLSSTTVKFEPSEDQEEEIRQWHMAVSRASGIMIRFISHEPNSDLGKRAAKLISSFISGTKPARSESPATRSTPAP